MRIEKNTVVSLNYELSDDTGKILEKTDTPISYLHGGYGGIFPLVEEAFMKWKLVIRARFPGNRKILLVNMMRS